MLISEPVVPSALVAVLLPPEVVPPFVSFVAPVVTVTVDVPVDVGVPVTGQLMLAPIATEAGGTGEHAPTTRPAGNPDTAHDAFVAAAVAVALLVQMIVPV